MVDFPFGQPGSVYGLESGPGYCFVEALGKGSVRVVLRLTLSCDGFLYVGSIWPQRRMARAAYVDRRFCLCPRGRMVMGVVRSWSGFVARYFGVLSSMNGFEYSLRKREDVSSAVG